MHFDTLHKLWRRNRRVIETLAIKQAYHHSIELSLLQGANMTHTLGCCIFAITMAIKHQYRLFEDLVKELFINSGQLQEVSCCGFGEAC
mgnify:CR=1 FL=1